MVDIWDRGLRPLHALGCVTGLAAILCGPASAQDGVRDEFFWLGQINKATAVINTQEGLLDTAKTPGIAKAIDAVIKAGNEPGARSRRK